MQEPRPFPIPDYSGETHTYVRRQIAREEQKRFDKEYALSRGASCRFVDAVYIIGQPGRVRGSKQVRRAEQRQRRRVGTTTSGVTMKASATAKAAANAQATPDPRQTKSKGARLKGGRYEGDGKGRAWQRQRQR